MSYETLALSIEDGIAHIELNRPERMNAMNRSFWGEMVRMFEEIDTDPSIRCVVISGRGRHFCSGLDLQEFAGLFQTSADIDPGRQREQLRRTILKMQESFNVIERCRVPVLAAVHGACIGGGVDLISACDCRYASADAFISIQEINVGLTADVGSLQRMPHLIPEGIVRELTFTGERMGTERAAQFGLWNDVSETRETLMARVMEACADHRFQGTARCRRVEGNAELHPRSYCRRGSQLCRNLERGNAGQFRCAARDDCGHDQIGSRIR